MSGHLCRLLANVTHSFLKCWYWRKTSSSLNIARSYSSTWLATYAHTISKHVRLTVQYCSDECAVERLGSQNKRRSLRTRREMSSIRKFSRISKDKACYNSTSILISPHTWRVPTKNLDSFPQYSVYLFKNFLELWL